MNRIATYMIRHPDWLWLVVIATPFRLINLGGESLWYDETFTAWLVKLDLPHMWVALQGDVHPPLYFLLQWINAHILGDSEAILRLPSAIFGVVAVILVWHIAREVGFDRQMAFVAGVISALLPGVLYYSQEARMYTLLLVFMLGAVWAAMRGRWVWFTFCCIGAVYTQNLGLFSVAALCIGAMMAQTRNIRMRPLALIAAVRRPLLATAVIGLAWLPWGLAIELKQTAGMGQDFWLQALGIGQLFEPIYLMTFGNRLSIGLLYASYAVAVGLTVIGLWMSRSWLIQPRGFIILAVVIGTPLLLAVVSVVWRSVYVSRAMIASAVLLALPWAYALCRARAENHLIAIAALAPLLIANLVAFYFPAQTMRVPTRERMAAVRQQWQASDVVYYSSIEATIAVSYYLQGLPYALKRENNGDLNQTLTSEAQSAMGFRLAEFNELHSLGYKRAWVIVRLDSMSSAAEAEDLKQILSTYPNSLFANYGMHGEFDQSGVYLVDLNE